MYYAYNCKHKQAYTIKNRRSSYDVSVIDLV